jgi:hypothetical protein
VSLTIYPKPVLGLPDPLAGHDRQRESARLYEYFQNNLHNLERDFKEAAERWERTGEDDPQQGDRPSTVKFTLRKLDIVPRGSFTLIAILGAVYIGVKDYEVVRRSLLAIAKDMVGIVTSLVAGFFPPDSTGFSPSSLWAIDSEVIVGTHSLIPQSPGPSDEATTPAPTTVVQGSPQAPPQGGSIWVWVAMFAFIGYLAITNVVLILLLGSLLRASP